MSEQAMAVVGSGAPAAVAGLEELNQRELAHIPVLLGEKGIGTTQLSSF